MGDTDTAIKGFRNRLTGLYFLRHIISGLSLSAFLGGAAVLAIRISWGKALQGTWSGIIAAIGLAAVIAYSLVRAFSKIPSMQVLRSLFDKTNRCGGLLMASSETDIGPWVQHITAVQSPGIQWNGRRFGLIFLSAIIFLSFSFLVPQRYVTPRSVSRLEISDQTQQAKEQIKILEEEQILNEETSQDMIQKIDHIEQTASGREPVKTWEALGHLQDQLKKTAEEASVEMLAETEALARTETLAQALNQMAADLDPQALEAAVSELTRITQAMLQQNEALQKALDDSLAAALAQSQLSPEQLEALRKALGGRKAELSQCMFRLCQAKLADLKLMQLCEKKGQCSAEGLLTLLGNCQGGSEAKEAIALFMNNPNWGIDRGRGDAPMVWSDPSSQEGTAFQEQVLPAASLEALEDSQLAGVSISAPSPEETDESQQSGNLRAAEAGSGQAVRQVILPKHKAVVKDYFQRDNETE